ncbi:MAG: winged helix-turn-helix domain-containing protein [Sphingomonas sp.]|nr:winged helix-turn-helix domain-containing protein [Sphingomonas sp.]
MTPIRDADASTKADAALIETLEDGSARLRAAAREIEHALAAIDTAIALARQASLPAPDRALASLLDAQHDRLARTLLRALGKDEGASEAAPAGAYPFRMDPEQRLARIGRRRIPLTESEYKVLELLWEQMPSPVSRLTIGDRLYADREGVSEAVIDMFIFKIRSKLRNAGCADAAIKAIRGKGWVLDLGDGAMEGDAGEG